MRRRRSVDSLIPFGRRVPASTGRYVNERAHPAIGLLAELQEKRHRRATGRGRQFKPAADAPGALSHAGDSVPIFVIGWIKAFSVVLNQQGKGVASQPEVNLSFGSARMPDHVVDAFLENQEDLAPDIGAKSDVN